MEKILVAVDFSDVTEPLVERATQLAGPLRAKLWLIHVAGPEPDFVGFEPGPQTVRDQVATELREEHRRAQDMAEQLRTSGLDATALCPQGPTVETILHEAEKLGVDLIAVGSHGHGALHRLLLGSVSEGVLRGASCPVLIVPTMPASD